MLHHHVQHVPRRITAVRRISTANRQKYLSRDL